MDCPFFFFFLGLGYILINKSFMIYIYIYLPLLPRLIYRFLGVPSTLQHGFLFSRFSFMLQVTTHYHESHHTYIFIPFLPFFCIWLNLDHEHVFSFLQPNHWLLPSMIFIQKLFSSFTFFFVLGRSDRSRTFFVRVFCFLFFVLFLVFCCGIKMDGWMDLIINTLKTNTYLKPTD